jgi:GDP-D-mannose 3',5'-epimerase
VSDATRPDPLVLVTGAGGFIGHRLVTHLKALGHRVRGVDLKLPAFGETEADEFLQLDLRREEDARAAVEGVAEVYALAAYMGGMGFLSENHAHVFTNNARIDLNTLEAAAGAGARRLLFTSSACVYPDYRQGDPDVVPLREEDAYPAQPDGAYGWEKLVIERLCAHVTDEVGLETRVARLHNVYGPEGTWAGGREKAPAAICRKVATARLTGDPEVEIWGDGRQTRSFCFVDDCVEGLERLMRSDHREPLNLGQDRLVTIDELVDLVAGIAGIAVVKRHVPGPQGVRGRNSDNSRLRTVLGWEPETSLEAGLALTYRWVEERVAAELGAVARPRATG